MAKIKLTKNELKTQRDALKRFERFLPTLQLKKQQLLLEVRQGREELSRLEAQLAGEKERSRNLAALLAGTAPERLTEYLRVAVWSVSQRNIAGTDVPVFNELRFADSHSDLFETPLWLDDALAALRHLAQLRQQQLLLNEQLLLLEGELRTVSQRVNLFEKVKIPEAKDNIRRINIYIGDQQTNSVGRSKIAKGKCQQRDAAVM